MLMVAYYGDSSALVKRYANETGTRWVRSLSDPQAGHDIFTYPIDHRTGQILAYVFGAREDAAFVEIKELLEPFGITRFYTGGWEAYRAILIRANTPLANNIHRRSNANTLRFVHGSNA